MALKSEQPQITSFLRPPPFYLFTHSLSFVYMFTLQVIWLNVIKVYHLFIL